MNKKAMIFTLLAIALLSLFLASYGYYSISGDRISINKRIGTMNNFVFSIEENLPRQLFISGFRIIFIFEKRINIRYKKLEEEIGAKKALMFWRSYMKHLKRIIKKRKQTTSPQKR